MRAWIKKIFRPTLDAIGINPKPGDSDDVNRLRSTLLATLNFDPEVQQQTRLMAEQYLDKRSGLPPTLVSTVLAVAAIGGDAKLYDRYLAAMKASESNPEEYYRFFNALASFAAPDLRSRTLKFALSNDVRSQDAPQLLAQLLGSEASQDETWEYVKKDWTAISAKFGAFQGIPGIINGLSGYCTADKAAEIKQFFTDHPVPEAARSLQLSLERISSCVALKGRQSAAFNTWIAAH
jgi:aminopeptidase N